MQKKFFKINKNLSSEIRKFKNNVIDQKEVQIKHLISGKLKILNLNFSKVYENKII